MSVSRRRFLEQATALSVTGVAAGAGALSFLPSGDAAAQAANGYELLPTPLNTADPDKVEVLEFFWFGCPHCYAFEPTINEYYKNKPDYVAEVRSLDVGVDEDKFAKTMKSFAVDAGIRRSMQLAQQSGITGVPSIVVNGKYRTSVSMAGGSAQAIAIIERLVELEKG